MLEWFTRNTKGKAATPRAWYGNPMNRSTFIHCAEGDDERLDPNTYARIREALDQSPVRFAYCRDDNTMLWHMDNSREWHDDQYGVKFIDAMMQRHLNQTEAVDALLYFRRHCLTAHCDIETKRKRLAASQAGPRPDR